MDFFLFHFQLLIGVIAQSHLAETDLVESTTVQQLWAGAQWGKWSFLRQIKNGHFGI
jgi:hypothetical protein